MGLRELRSMRGGAGFTLLELLVVVTIVAVISAGIVLSLNAGGRDPGLEKESTRLLGLLRYAREQAELQTRDYGLMLQDDGYEFLSYDVRRRQWRALGEDDPLHLRKLPDGLDFRLVVEGRPVVLRRPKDATDKTPQVTLFANGDLTSCEITLERDAGVRSVTLVEDEHGEVIARPMVEINP